MRKACCRVKRTAKKHFMCYMRRVGGDRVSDVDYSKHEKKNPSAEFIKVVCTLYNDCYDDREEDSPLGGKANHTSLSSFQIHVIVLACIFCPIISPRAEIIRKFIEECQPSSNNYILWIHISSGL